MLSLFRKDYVKPQIKVVLKRFLPLEDEVHLGGKQKMSVIITPTISTASDPTTDPPWTKETDRNIQMAEQ